MYITHWAEKVREKLGIKIILDVDHWQKKEIDRDYGINFMSYSSEHITIPRGPGYDILEFKPTPEFKILLVGKTMIEKMPVYKIYRWSQELGRYTAFLGEVYDLIGAMTICEYHYLGQPWIQDYPNPREKQGA
jgi:hypothetical protein